LAMACLVTGISWARPVAVAFTIPERATMTRRLVVSERAANRASLGSVLGLTCGAGSWQRGLVYLFARLAPGQLPATNRLHYPEPTTTSQLMRPEPGPRVFLISRSS
jgi:hypothetical protein